MNRLFLVIILSVFPTISVAETQFPKTFKCTFDKGVFTANSVSKPDDFKSEKTKDSMELIFDNIDLKQHKARLIGNAGTSDIFVQTAGESLHLLETTPSGNLNVTTIYIRAMAAGDLFSVHSRHVGSASAPMVSQFWGSCKRFE